MNGFAVPSIKSPEKLHWTVLYQVVKDRLKSNSTGESTIREAQHLRAWALSMAASSISATFSTLIATLQRTPERIQAAGNGTIRAPHAASFASLRSFFVD